MPVFVFEIVYFDEATFLQTLGTCGLDLHVHTPTHPHPPPPPPPPPSASQTVDVIADSVADCVHLSVDECGLSQPQGCLHR